MRFAEADCRVIHSLEHETGAPITPGKMALQERASVNLPQRPKATKDRNSVESTPVDKLIESQGSLLCITRLADVHHICVHRQPAKGDGVDVIGMTFAVDLITAIWAWK